mgnify:CR=1 FL=1
MRHLAPSTLADRKTTNTSSPDAHDLRRLRVETETVRTDEGAAYQVSTYYRKGSPRPVAVRYGDGPIEWNTTPPRKPAQRKIAGILTRSTRSAGGERSTKIVGREHVPMKKHGVPRATSPLEPPPTIEALQAQVARLAAKVAAGEQPTPAPVAQASPLPAEPPRPRLRRRGGR